MPPGPMMAICMSSSIPETPSAQRREALPISGRASVGGLSGAVTGLKVLDAEHAVMAVPAWHGLGRGVGLDARGVGVAGAGRLGRGGGVRHAGHAEGGAADDAC